MRTTGFVIYEYERWNCITFKIVEMMNDERDISGSRTNAMILSMIPELKSGGKIGVAGCKDPKDITERLKAHGIDVKSEPMISTKPIKAIHNLNSIEGEIIGIEYGEKVQIGFFVLLLKDIRIRGIKLSQIYTVDYLKSQIESGKLIEKEDDKKGR